MTRQRLALAPALCGAFALGCGPTPIEAAGSVLCVSPAIVGLSAALLWLNWAPLARGSGVGFPWGAVGTAMGLCLVLVAFGTAALAYVSWDPETLVLALWCAGTSYLALTQVIWRIWHALQPGTAVVGALGVSAVVMFLPAFPQLLTPEQTDFTVAAWVLWLYTGMAGLIPGGILLLLWGEAGVRFYLKRRRAVAQPH